MRSGFFPQGAILTLTAFALMLPISACSATDVSKSALPTATLHVVTPSAIATVGFRVSGWT